MSRLPLAALAAFVVLTSGAREAAAEWLSSIVGAEHAEALAAYARNPRRNAKDLVARYAGNPGDRPVLLTMVVADAELRLGQPAAAEERFGSVVALPRAGVWGQWARIGLAWAAILRDDRAAAREWAGRVTEARGPLEVAAFLTAFVDAIDRHGSAADRLRRLAGDGTASPVVREGAALLAGYALHWAGDHAAAAGQLDRLVAARPASRLADDARYAAAWALARDGRTDDACARLRGIAGRGGRRRAGPVTRRLVALEPAALVAAGFRRHRKAPLGPPEALIGDVLDGDGVSLARAAHRHLGCRRASAGPDGGARLPAIDSRGSTAARVPDVARAPGRPRDPERAPVPPPRPAGAPQVLVGVVVALAAALVLRSIARRR